MDMPGRQPYIQFSQTLNSYTRAWCGSLFKDRQRYKLKPFYMNNNFQQKKHSQYEKHAVAHTPPGNPASYGI